MFNLQERVGQAVLRALFKQQTVIIDFEVTNFLQNMAHDPDRFVAALMSAFNYQILDRKTEFMKIFGTQMKPQGAQTKHLQQTEITAAELPLTMVNIYTGGKATSMQVINSAKPHSPVETYAVQLSQWACTCSANTIPLVSFTAGNQQGLSRVGEILLFACFFTSMLQHFACSSLPAAKTCNLLNEESLFLPKYSAGYNFLRTSGMVHPPPTSLFVSLLW